MNGRVGRRHGSDPTLLWLWCRPAGVAPMRPLAWEPPCAAGAAPEKTKNKQTKNPNVSPFEEAVKQFLHVKSGTEQHFVCSSSRAALLSSRTALAAAIEALLSRRNPLDKSGTHNRHRKSFHKILMTPLNQARLTN